MNEGAQVRNLFLNKYGGIRAKRGNYLENATKHRAPRTGLGARGEEECRSARNLNGGRAFCKEC